MCKFFDLSTFTEALTYKAKDDDVFIVTYPKNGTIWMQIIVYLIQHNGLLPTDRQSYLFSGSVFLEHKGLQGIVAIDRPATIKPHSPAHLVP